MGTPTRTAALLAKYADYLLAVADNDVEQPTKRAKLDQGQEASPEAELLGGEEQDEAPPGAGSDANVAGGDEANADPDYNPGNDPDYVPDDGEDSQVPKATGATKQPRVVLSLLDQAQGRLTAQQVTGLTERMTSAGHTSLSASEGKPTFVRLTSFFDEVIKASVPDDCELSPDECVRQLSEGDDWDPGSHMD
ncbi:hypothetical protein N2152v2_000510 [Parachlorella kessleri]